MFDFLGYFSLLEGWRKGDSDVIGKKHVWYRNVMKMKGSLIIVSWLICFVHGKRKICQLQGGRSIKIRIETFIAVWLWAFTYQCGWSRMYTLRTRSFQDPIDSNVCSYEWSWPSQLSVLACSMAHAAKKASPNHQERSRIPSWNTPNLAPWGISCALLFRHTNWWLSLCHCLAIILLNFAILTPDKAVDTT